MTNVHFDPAFKDEERRNALYAGDLLVYSPLQTSTALARHAADMIEEAFGGRDPRMVQHEIPVEDFASIAAPLKRDFIHHPRSLKMIAELMLSLGCDPLDTYIDVPRLRMATSHGYFTSGVAYAHHPHRDTWYSAPMCQINWWMPIYGFEARNAMAFHPRYFTEGVPNDSHLFNYYTWNSKQRREATNLVKEDTRWQPRTSAELELEPDIRLIPNAGGLIAFSAAQLHSTVPNTSGVTRWSMDFRTISLSDFESARGAANVDSRPQGTSVRDFVRVADFERVAESVAGRHDGSISTDGELVFQPSMT
jgi:hypothetical protein